MAAGECTFSQVGALNALVHVSHKELVQVLVQRVRYIFAQSGRRCFKGCNNTSVYIEWLEALFKHVVSALN